MPIANCKRCQRIFNKVRRDICQNCIEETDKVFLVVREYLKENKDANMSQVTEATGVDVEDIVDLIRDGRLILRDNPNLSYGCERCGQPTQAGRFCAKCAKELAAGFETARVELQSKAKEGRPGYFSRNN